MEKKYYLFFAIAALALTACNPQEELPPAAKNIQPETISQYEKIAEMPEPATDVVTMLPQPQVSHYIKTKVFKSSDSVEHVEYRVSPALIDSLNKIIPLFDTTVYDKMIVSYFTSLSGSLHGRPFFAESADSILNAILEILSTRLNDGTDIVFLIDKTGSMEDDIDTVQQSMKKILDYLENFSNVKVAIAEYGDKNWHDAFWYNRTDLSNDIDEMKEFLGKYKTIINPDIPESVNDAIVRTVTEINWTPGNKRLMMVIGDAPSQLPPLSDYSMSQVIAKCDSMNVTFNLYPIILSSANWLSGTPKFSMEEFTKVYPNPASTIVNVEVNNEKQFLYRLCDLTGKVAKEGTVSNLASKIDVGDLSNGNYLLQIYDDSASKFNSSMLVVQH